MQRKEEREKKIHTYIYIYEPGNSCPRSPASAPPGRSFQGVGGGNVSMRPSSRRCCERRFARVEYLPIIMPALNRHSVPRVILCIVLDRQGAGTAGAFRIGQNIGGHW